MKKMFGCLVSAILFLHTLSAQPFTLRSDIKPVALEFHKFEPKEEPKAKGRLNVTNVTQIKDTMYFFASGMSIYSPVYVGLTLADKSKSVDVKLAKMNWNNADRSGNTGSKGHWESVFKTENDFGVMVIAKDKPVQYSLVVWNGAEDNFTLPSVFKNGPAEKQEVTKEEKKGDSEGFLKKNGLYIIIALLLVIIGIMFFKMRNNKS